MAPGPAVRHRDPARLPGPPVHRVRRRRRIRHADGGVRHRLPLRAADQGGHQQQRRARPDPVGADGARLSRSSASASSGSRLRRRGPRRAAASGVRVDKSADARGGRHARLRASRARRWSTCSVNPDEPPMPGKVTYEQAKASPRPSCAANRTRPRSPPRCSGTRSASCARERPTVPRQRSAAGRSRTSASTAFCATSPWPVRTGLAG